MTQAADTIFGFIELFTGRADAYGVSEGGVRHEQLTPEHYRRHLTGGQGIGVFPMIPGDVVRFAAIDLDRPDFELARLMGSLIPGTTWIERSRSGNAHVWVFFEDECPAWAARGVLRHVCYALGERTVEVFPKQERLLPGMVGNYINLPYHGYERYIYEPNEDGTLIPLQLDTFVGEALTLRTDPDRFVRDAEKRGVTPTAEHTPEGEFGQQGFLHQCAEYILANAETNPIQPGHRQAVTFHVAKQLLNWDQLDEDEAFELVRDLNNAGTDPLSDYELRMAFRNAASGRYRYTGCDDPLMAPYVHPDCPFAR